jgi:hypothetical protein
MFDESKSLYAKNISPLIQVAVVICVILLFDLGALVLAPIESIPIKPGAPWMIFTSFVLCYALINSVLSISTSKQNRYWIYSILSYVVLLIVGSLISYLFSGLTMDEAGSYRWILLIFSMSYILFLLIVGAMKRIVNYAQKQDKRLRGEE